MGRFNSKEMNPLNVGLSIESAKINKFSLQTRTSLGLFMKVS
ncbi:MAG TPA: hypothetical protein PLO05_11155 [Bacteroidales bacterium]|nr:hypothetical protein [Bacteroidales bacterium]